MKGLELLEEIKNEKYGNNTIIVVRNITNSLKNYKMIYRNNNIIWDSNTFKLTHLIDDDYDFDVVKNDINNILESLKLDQNTINDVVDRIARAMR